MDAEHGAAVAFVVGTLKANSYSFPRPPSRPRWRGTTIRWAMDHAQQCRWENVIWIGVVTPQNVVLEATGSGSSQATAWDSWIWFIEPRSSLSWQLMSGSSNGFPGVQIMFAHMAASFAAFSNIPISCDEFSLGDLPHACSQPFFLLFDSLHVAA